MSPNPKPLFGSDVRSGAGQRNERLLRFAVAAVVVFGLLQIRAGRWKNGIVPIGLTFLVFYRLRQDRIKRQSAPTVHHRSERRSRSLEHALGELPHAPVNPSEVRFLKGTVARLIHQRLRVRQDQIRRSLSGLAGLRWTVAEDAGGKFAIGGQDQGTSQRPNCNAEYSASHLLSINYGI